MAAPRILTFALAAALLVAASGAAHADRTKAAEHFALAEKAEARQDWRAAIAEYELAYDASPHPSVQFNIAKVYERLSQARDAARHYQRYLDESGPDAEDRAAVVERLAELRARPSKVQVLGNPPGAQVLVDERTRGAAPLTVTLEAGEHTLALEHDGRRSPAQTITLEYGDPVTVRLDLNVRPGTLMVFANVDGAEVAIDGKVAGYTPLTGQVPAGDYDLVISKPGYKSAQRPVDVPAGGSRQVRVVLEPIDGAAAAEEVRGAKILFGWGLGFDIGGDSARYVLDLAYRAPSNRYEVGLLLGALGSNAGAGIGADARLYFATGRVRPYARAGVLLGGSSTSSSTERVVLVEGGAGVLIIGTQFGKSYGVRQTRTRYAIDYFVELDVNYRLQEPMADQSRISIPIVGGVLFRYGGE